ncbi:MAG: hypothetical protein NTW49_07030 [Bacteroidia bacterium]|nr:hypothetical protein [Bacteroidia bacterium]
MRLNFQEQSELKILSRIVSRLAGKGKYPVALLRNFGYRACPGVYTRDFSISKENYAIFGFYVLTISNHQNDENTAFQLKVDTHYRVLLPLFRFVCTGT